MSIEQMSLAELVDLKMKLEAADRLLAKAINRKSQTMAMNKRVHDLMSRMDDMDVVNTNGRMWFVKDGQLISRLTADECEALYHLQRNTNLIESWTKEW